MSRCFPFPPPGYEKKVLPDVANVLKKEKTKEKKHKEKRDKEKKEGRDRRDKGKSNGKHREKKDKKEKHKDKKKDKEKEKEKDQEKASTSAEKRVSGQGEEYGRAKVHQSEKERGEEKKERNSTSNNETQIGQFGYCNGEKVHQKVEKSREEKNTSDEKKFTVHSFADKEWQDSKFMLEFSKRISDDGKGSGSQLVDEFMGMGCKKDERTDKFAVRDTCMVVEGKEKLKDKQVDNWNIDGRRVQHEEKFNGNAMSQNLNGSIQNKTGVSKLKDKFDGSMEGKERLNERQSDDKRGDKRKSKHKDKQSQEKDKAIGKEKRKEEKAKKERQKSEKDNSRSSNKNDVGTPNNKASHLSKDSGMNAATEVILKKRKDIEKNGFLHEYLIRPEKMPRLSSHPLSENGHESKPFQTTTLFTSQKPGTDNNFEVDNKDNKINDITGQHQLPISGPNPSPVIAEQLPHQLPISGPKPLPVIAEQILHQLPIYGSKASPVIAEQIAEASRKPPHPDMKYLSKVLSVPQMDEWSEVDDQAWLFNNKDSLLNKSKVDPVGVNQGQQVWAETLRIESADVFALPYVIPY